MPEVSVIMPAYNAEKTISASVSSVLAQSFADYELIIVDDCSGDGSHAICKAFAAADARVSLYRNDANRGVAFSRNRGIAAAKGRWIAFLDSDDLWQVDKLERQLRFIEETGAAISYTASAFIDARGKGYAYVLHAKKELSYRDLLRRNLMSCSSVIVRRDLMLGESFVDGPLHEDYAAWLRIVRSTGPAYGLDEPLLTYRVSRSSRSGQRLRSGAMVYRTYREVGYGAARSMLMTLRYAAHSIIKHRHFTAR